MKRYVWSNSPDLLPVDWEENEDVDELLIKAAGFDPGDEEVGNGRLKEEWNGHPVGSLVISGKQVDGHPFAIEEEVRIEFDMGNVSAMDGYTHPLETIPRNAGFGKTILTDNEQDSGYRGIYTASDEQAMRTYRLLRDYAESNDDMEYYDTADDILAEIGIVPKRLISVKN